MWNINDLVFIPPPSYDYVYNPNSTPKKISNPSILDKGYSTSSIFIE
jgi:hypothetical protein